MVSLKTVGVKELKNNLSAYLREVRRGVRVFVADRQQVVAELREPGAVPEAALDPTLAAWVEAGEVRLPTAPKAPLPESPVRLSDGTARRWLDALREEGGR
jgi:antitoxin (DNA-binding transcriptional repressor) of toxin-antitoxin stability system